MKCKISTFRKSTIFTLALLCAGTSIAQAAPGGDASSPSMERKIQVTATVGDSIFVSAPDLTWYHQLELDATNATQTSFKKAVPVRVWTKTESAFNVSMVRPFDLTMGANNSLATEVKFGEEELNTQSTLNFPAGKSEAENGYYGIYDLEISANSDPAAGEAKPGTYAGDLVMMFEVAS